MPVRFEPRRQIQMLTYIQYHRFTSTFHRFKYDLMFIVSMVNRGKFVLHNVIQILDIITFVSHLKYKIMFLVFVSLIHESVSIKLTAVPSANKNKLFNLKNCSAHFFRVIKKAKYSACFRSIRRNFQVK